MDSPEVAGEEYTRIRTSQMTPWGRKFAIGSDGNPTTLVEARKQFAKKHRQRWGSLTLESANLISKANKQPLGQYFDVLAFPTDTIDATVADLNHNDISMSARVKPTSLLAGRLGLDQIRVLAKLDSVQRVVVASPTVARPDFNPNGRTAADYSHSNTEEAFVYPGEETCTFYGRRVPVGIAEPGLETLGDAGCGLWDRHESVEFVDGITHMNPVETCRAGIHTDCQDACGDGRCVEMLDGTNQCAARHANHVFSRISSSVNGTPQHAAMSPYFFAGLSPNVTFSEMMDAMDWFVSNDVRIINQSFHTESLQQNFGYLEVNIEGILNDIYARNHDISVIKAAGNDSVVVDCRGRTEICVGSIYSGCPSAKPCVQDSDCDVGGNGSCEDRYGNPYVGGQGEGRCACDNVAQCHYGNTYATGCIDDPAHPDVTNGRKVCDCSYNQFYPTYQTYEDDFRWRSPWVLSSNTPPPAFMDVQVPDILAQGAYANVMNLENDFGFSGFQTDWSQNVGSSFAAPVVTGLVALLHEKRPNLSHLSTRALVRHSGNPKHQARPDNVQIDHIYPFGVTAPAWPAGTGMADGRILSWMAGDRCVDEEGQTNRDDGEGEHRDGDNWSEIPQWASNPDEDFHTRFDDLQTYQMPLKSNRRWMEVYAPDYGTGLLPVRIRATLAFLSCVVPEPDNVSTLPPAIDFDLHLCSPSAEECYGESEYIDDVDEGFDIVVPRGMPADTALYVSKPDGATACPRAVVSGTEPFAWAASWHARSL